MDYRIIKIVLLLFIPLHLFGQVSLSETEISLQALHKEISRENTDLENISINDSIAAIFGRTLNTKESFEYPFDSLKFMGKIISDDNKVRFFTWNLPLSNGTNHYIGFIVHRSDALTNQVLRLKDKSATIQNAETAILSAEQWYGCLVYDIIDTRLPDETAYTLIGYDPDNLFTSKKLIDILTFSNGVPVFGKPVFKVKNNKIVSRVFFEYSSRVQMTLKWNVKLKMIVFDHLAPSSPAYQGNYRYYGPDFSYDGLKFEKGFWEYREDVDVREN